MKVFSKLCEVGELLLGRLLAEQQHLSVGNSPVQPRVGDCSCISSLSRNLQCMLYPDGYPVLSLGGFIGDHFVQPLTRKETAPSSLLSRRPACEKHLLLEHAPHVCRCGLQLRLVVSGDAEALKRGGEEEAPSFAALLCVQ